MRRLVWAIVAAGALSLPTSGNAQAVVLSGTEVRKLSSPIVGHDFELFIAKPDGYDTASTHYPVLYVLDAYDQFALVTQLYRILRLANHVPALLLVGISYPGGYADYIRYRALDFTPTKLPVDSVRRLYGAAMAQFTPMSGGADAFLRSLQAELIPYVDRNYRTNLADRGVLGMSYGGLFTSIVLAQVPGLFQRVLIGSPALWWDDYVFFRKSPATLPPPASPTRVLLTVGADETRDMITAFERLRAYMDTTRVSAPTVTFSAAKFPDESHMTIQGIMYSRALRTLYAK